MKTYAVKYVELMERHAEDIAKKWAKDVRQNTKTTYYKFLDEQKIISQCVRFYQYFSKMYGDEKVSEDVLTFFKTYARETYEMGIPLDEAIYALILMRRHIWLHPEFQYIFTSGIARADAVDSLNRTILLFDYAEYQITKDYMELAEKGARRK
jgi:hypothetical protein